MLLPSYDQIRLFHLLGIQFLQILDGFVAHTANQQIFTCKAVVNKVMQKMEIPNLAGMRYVNTGAGAEVGVTTDGNVIVINICDRKVLLNHCIDLCFKFLNAKFFSLCSAQNALRTNF